MNRSILWLGVALSGLSLGCGSEAITGVTPVHPTPPPPPAQTALAVEVSGQARIDQAGKYIYRAKASGGAGEYAFQWQVSAGPGPLAAARAGDLGPVTYTTPDGYYVLHVGSGDGDLILRVTVTTASEQATSSIYIRNCIGGCTTQP